MRNEILKRLEAARIVSENDDPDQAHRNADEALCDLLTSLGYEDVVEAFNKVEKWYA